MKKRFFLFLVLFSFIYSAASAENIRVSCGKLTMNVPDSDVTCYKTSEGSILGEESATEELAAAQLAGYSLHITSYETGSAIQPEISYYQISDLEKTSFSLIDITTGVSDLVSNVLEDYMEPEETLLDMPFLPVQTEERTLNGWADSIHFGGGSGIRFITGFGDPVNASASGNLYYTMQGISEDGETFISAVIPLKSSVLNGASAGEIDWESLTDMDFIPTISSLDFLMSSIVLE